MKLLKSSLIILCFFSIFISPLSAITEVQEMRRPLGPEHPMLIIHFNLWAAPNPSLIIDLIPEDVRPYVVFNVAMSQNTSIWGQHDMFALAESWLRVCAEKGVWCQIQNGAGGYNNFPDRNLTVYEYFYKTYPNFIGFSFAELNPGMNDDIFPGRLSLIARLLEMSHKYGGYVMISDSHSMNGPQFTPLARLKRHSAFELASKEYSNHLVVFEKYTMGRGYYDQESLCLGTWLSGYAGHYGFRYDRCGWTNSASRGDRPVPESVGGSVITEHIMLTGQTVIDGPETVDEEVIYGFNDRTSDNYFFRNFAFRKGFVNMYMDQFRKILDGIIRIPTKQEVYDHTKIAMINDIESNAPDPNAGMPEANSNRKQYSSLRTIFTGLYANEGDTVYTGASGVDKNSLEWSGNTQWFKNTGRYPSIPTMHKNDSYTREGFQEVITHSEYKEKFGGEGISEGERIANKVAYFNNLFPEKYTGNLFADRINNHWITYHNDMDVATPRTADIPLVYNTCEKMKLTYSFHNMGVIKEYSDELHIYLNNYCSSGIKDKDMNVIPDLRENVIEIFGSLDKPSYSFHDRGDINSGNVSVTESWVNGVFTLKIKHNGPVDLVIKCKGNATDRLTSNVSSTVKSIPGPPTYYGPYQHEFEDFEYSGIRKIHLTGYGVALSSMDVHGLGYMDFGQSSAAKIRKKINVLKTGEYLLKIRYSAPDGTSAIYMSVNSEANKAISFSKTSAPADWQIHEELVILEAGSNILEFKARAGQTNTLYLDNVVIEDPHLSSDKPVYTQYVSIVKTEYYTLMGQKVNIFDRSQFKGVYIVKNTMSDGSVQSEKVYFR